MQLFARGTPVFQHAKVCGYASRVAGSLRFAWQRDSKLCAVGWLVSTRHNAQDAFALPKQAPTHVLRRREGLEMYTHAGKNWGIVTNAKGEVEPTDLEVVPTLEERELVSKLRGEANKENGQWQHVLSSYSGSNPVVLTAAMHAALKKRHYEEGFQIYKKLTHMTLPSYTIAMKLLGKLGKVDEVERLWTQLIELDLVGQPQAGGRIDAAADNGDIQAAGRVLDYMKGKGIEANVLHFSSAINACANAKDQSRAEAAQGFFDQMLAAGMKPNIVTYCSLLRAFQQEPRQRLLDLLVHMKDQHVKPDSVFAESFLFIFLRQPGKGAWTTVDVIASDLRKRPLADLQVAKEFIEELRDDARPRVRLTRSCEAIDVALRRVQEEAQRLMGQRG
ncbi:Pentatricopeptide repeat-containing protein At5g46100 [Durusdinium trenchii]|uniref:Pentatricopeptide repeat-containing protein At5g46100 n=1 Tax=Durusdinium trenchii TaxID=1381693 RepID=A0ABP0NF84_9DINO